MNDIPKTILVTGIGGNVGQGIIRIAKTLPYAFRFVGTNIELPCNGNHLSDVIYEVPFGYDSMYIPTIQRICKKERVDLIIPSTDFESYALSQQKKRLPPVATSHETFNGVCLDKYKTYEAFARCGIPFAESILPYEYKNQFDDVVVKPRKGRGSKNIIMNPADIHGFDDSYIVQKRYHGKELTSAFYVTKRKHLVGSITMERSLFAGATKECSVTRTFDRVINRIVKRIVSNFGVIGSCNIQSIALDKNTVIPFELNSRISGTNSVRHFFGFQDVRWTLEEWLFHKTPPKPVIITGTAFRYLADVIYPDCTISAVKNTQTKHIIFS